MINPEAYAKTKKTPFISDYYTWEKVLRLKHEMLHKRADITLLYLVKLGLKHLENENDEPETKTN